MEQQDDEISLIDLLVVLLKHWKLVVAIPLIVAIFAGALYLYRTTITKPVQKTETSISFSVNPLVKQFVGSVNLEGSIVNVYLKDTRLFYDILSLQRQLSM
jgi:capsular polysaccharide biosynthesis protein